MNLEQINSSADLKKSGIEELPRIAEQIRSRMIDVVSETGGHLASSLGAVELTLALHYCLNVPKDKIVWDVGHQSYAHKILTGRNKDFSALRQYQGLSGFPCKDESACDPFTTGHSSTAVSLALGLVAGRDAVAPRQDYKVVAVIGDGSLSGGLCFEGLNNAGHLKKDILVILNTNELSIAPNVGAISTYLNKLISLPLYNRFRNSLEDLVASRVPKGSRLLKIANKFEEGLKGLFIPGLLFEELGFRYFGPLDGHNLTSLVPTIKNILQVKGPRLLHVVTKKGKGYYPAEKDPVRFHSAAPFDILTGNNASREKADTKTYTQVFGKKIVELAKSNKRIMAITAAMPEGTGLDAFRDAYPDRFFDVGIAEGHAVCFAAGLACSGLKPIVAIYSTFLQRAYDQIIETVALQDLPVVFVLDRAGIVGDDGPTHQGIFDISYLRSIPKLVIMAPADSEELEKMLEFAVRYDGAPLAIRYPKDRVPAGDYRGSTLAKIELGKAQVLTEGKDYALIAFGSMVAPALEAQGRLQLAGFSGTVVNARFARPLDTVLYQQLAKKHTRIFVAEDGISDGGLASALSYCLRVPVIPIGVAVDFIPCGKRGQLLEINGLTPEGLVKTITKAMASEEIARRI